MRGRVWLIRAGYSAATPPTEPIIRGAPSLPLLSPNCRFIQSRSLRRFPYPQVPRPSNYHRYSSYCLLVFLIPQFIVTLHQLSRPRWYPLFANHFVPFNTAYPLTACQFSLTPVSPYLLTADFSTPKYLDRATTIATRAIILLVFLIPQFIVTLHQLSRPRWYPLRCLHTTSALDANCYSTTDSYKHPQHSTSRLSVGARS